MKDLFKTDLGLARPDPELTLKLQVNLSEKGMGAVLYQAPTYGSNRTISYTSAKFSDTEKRYPPMEQECHALVWAVRRFRPFLEESKFQEKTHPNVLHWLGTTKETKPKFRTWITFLEKFDYDLLPRKIRGSELPQALALYPVENTAINLDEEEEILPPEESNKLITPGLYL